MNHRIDLRPAGPDDGEFLFQVFQAARREPFAAAGWTPAALEAFLRGQHRLQDQHYHSAYPGAAFAVILLDGVAVGNLYVDRTARAIHLIDIALLPAQRGQGIGGALLAELAREADTSGRPVALHVEVTNRAAGWYRRLGFLDQGGDGVYLSMLRPPAVPERSL